eukprot:RCo024115
MGPDVLSPEFWIMCLCVVVGLDDRENGWLTDEQQTHASFNTPTRPETSSGKSAKRLQVNLENFSFRKKTAKPLRPNPSTLMCKGGGFFFLLFLDNVAVCFFHLQ